MKLRDKAPAYQWYPKDHDADEDVKLMTYAQEGMLRKLLDHQWLHGSIPADPAQIARLLGKGTNHRLFTSRDWPAIAMKFVAAGVGRLRNAKLERQRRERQAYVQGQQESGRRGAALRWGRDRQPNGQTIVSPEGGDSSASAVRPPLPPAPGGRITRGEREIAKRVRNSNFGCRHEPRCQIAAACVDRMVLEMRDNTCEAVG